MKVGLILYSVRDEMAKDPDPEDHRYGKCLYKGRIYNPGAGFYKTSKPDRKYHKVYGRLQKIYRNRMGMR